MRMRDIKKGQMIKLAWAIFPDELYDKQLGEVFYFDARESMGRSVRHGERTEFRTPKPAVYLGGPVSAWSKPLYYDGAQVHLVWVWGHGLGRLGRPAYITNEAVLDGGR